MRLIAGPGRSKETETYYWGFYYFLDLHQGTYSVEVDTTDPDLHAPEPPVALAAASSPQAAPASGAELGISTAPIVTDFLPFEGANLNFDFGFAAGPTAVGLSKLAADSGLILVFPLGLLAVVGIGGYSLTTLLRRRLEVTD